MFGIHCTQLVAIVKWNNTLSTKFPLQKGTRQGGLTSPFLFNIMYQDLIEGLSNVSGGMRIGCNSFNVFCYADDLLLTSSTVTGLQSLIDFANQYVTSHGLSFNASKSSTIIFGKHYFYENPVWYVNNNAIVTKETIDYLGAILSNDSNSHSKIRLKKCRHAFYSLKSAGICNNSLDPLQFLIYGELLYSLFLAMLMSVLNSM